MEMKLTVNFDLNEFECHCGCEMGFEIPGKLVTLCRSLEIIRAEFNKPITIVSGYRCKKHNKAVGGAENSKHCEGIAADIRIKGVSISNLHKAILKLIDEKKIPNGGVGVYKNWIHYDIRKGAARWNG